MPTTEATEAVARDRTRLVAIAVLVAGVAVCWILLAPPGAAPDEPSHLARSGAVARWDLDGVDLGIESLEGYDLPDSYRLPEPGCYAFQPSVTVACADAVTQSGATVQLASRADEYPIWGHLVYGLGSRLPGSEPIWWARLTGGAVAVALVIAALRLRTRPLAAAGVTVAMTPMAWSTVTTVNPSSFGIAGAVALWSALLHDRLDDRFDDGRMSIVRWLTAAAWAALALPRRDGLIWAVLILSICLAATDRTPADWWRRLGTGPQLVVVGTTMATVVWGFGNDSRVSRMVALSPLAIGVFAAVQSAWRRFATGRSRRVAFAGGCVAALALVTLVLARMRPGGWDGALARAVVDETGRHLVEAVGVLGWLDVELPGLAVVLAFAAIGLLVAASLRDRPHALTVAAVLVVVAIFTSWVFELFQGNTSARYWQGRYSLPLLVGVPIVLTGGAVPATAARRLAAAAGCTMLVVVNIAAWSAARRWGAGVDGTLLPWRWGTVHQPVDPFVLLVTHAACTVGLATVLFARPEPGRSSEAAGARLVDEVRRRTRPAG